MLGAHFYRGVKFSSEGGRWFLQARDCFEWVVIRKEVNMMYSEAKCEGVILQKMGMRLFHRVGRVVLKRRTSA